MLSALIWLFDSTLLPFLLSYGLELVGKVNIYPLQPVHVYVCFTEVHILMGPHLNTAHTHIHTSNT